ncbi:hypothetical protein [Commensalibacter communis]|uniref:Uncharacterized protein n=1 Tax=Commensalibacter communis TaxID=2972786 RepID=A0A9W4X773_9PROT|nr:hypothetical protein [Commensalibacter communis]CAI3948187.1 unnamed protein product [Commensalibacter communis]CAI3951396.1 unnamed protein product [Commensalibacter communis]CAI3951616.1 unnamed protein product [Commensalibacter communis]CAI3952515.1 unnamed protein product [Commensalibacter communis]CAI3953158.1 unnamed protein product [Commensalibacter communis]
MKSAKDILVGLMCMSGIIFALSSHAKTSIQSMPLYKEALPEDALKEYPVLSYNFIDLIHIIAKSSPTSFDKLQKVFDKEFTIKEKSNDLSLYQVKNVVTKDGVIEKKYQLK